MSTSSEWGDLPSSTDFFSSEFFGDDLIDMYTNSGDDLGEGITSHEDEVSNGMLVAMNAAAMDGDLFGTSEFIPASVSSAPVEATPASAHAEVKSEPASAPAPVHKPATYAVKRTVTQDGGAAPAAKKAKAAPVSKPPTTVTTRSAAASSVTTRASTVKPTAKPTPATSAPPTVKPGSIPGKLPSSISVPPPRTSTAPATKVPGKVPAPTGAVKMPVGGVTHQVVPRPTSYATAARRVPPPPSMTKAGGIVAQAAAHNKAHAKPMQVASSGVKRALSEADFKNVASAAVSSLIQSASTGTQLKGKGLAGAKPTEKPVDTSTSHVLALTSQSWITACSNPIPTPAQSNSEVDKAARNARRAALTQEERAKQNRDRNREHARNTRLRKKAYVEELKRTLTEIVTQRDAADVEKMHSAQREREQREVRFRVMEEFLKLRGRNESNSTRWVAILEDGFTLTLPRTGYRQMVKGEKPVDGDAESRSSFEQVIRGAGPTMEDSQYLSDFLHTIGVEAVAQSSQVQLAYRCDRKRFFMDSNTAFMDFDATTAGAVAKGLQKEVAFKGSMRSLFSPASNKLISVDITFDTGTIVYQLERMGHTVTNHYTEDDVAEAALAAAANAANEADALLDSLQVPQIAINGGPVSVSSDDGSNQL